LNRASHSFVLLVITQTDWRWSARRRFWSSWTFASRERWLEGSIDSAFGSCSQLPVWTRTFNNFTKSRVTGNM
jgi:hypothetical protein